MNLGLSLFIAVASLLYLGYIIIKYGVQKSISASVYKLETSVKKSLYAWFIFCVALPMMILSDNWMGVVAGMFLSLDFAAPAGGDKMQRFVHSLGANVGMILGIAMLGFQFGQWWLVGITVFVILLLYVLDKINKIRNSVWWIEVAVLVSVWSGLLIEKVI